MMTDLRIEIRTLDSLLDNAQSLPLYMKFGDRALESGFESATPPNKALNPTVGRRRPPAG